MGTPTIHRNRVSVIINKEQTFIESPITGSDLRRIAEIPAENQLFREQPGDEPDELIRDDVTYEVKPGTHFYDLPRGTVGATSVGEQVEYARARLAEAEVARQDDGIYLVRWSARVPDLWSPTEMRLIVLFPPMFPAQAPSGFDAVGTATLRGAMPGGGGMRSIGGESCTHFCWNPQGKVDYTSEDAVWRFAKFAESRFLTLQ